MFSLYELIPNDPPVITIVDVGAMALGGDNDAYSALLKNRPVRIVGFEPIRSECDKLNSMNAAGRLYLPHAIGDGTARTFYQCNYPMTSSLYQPNTELLDKFQNLEKLVQVVSTSDVKTHRLDDIAEIGDVDYLKVDVQGAEVDVFNGARRTLQDAVVIHAEVEFVPLYRNQPLFSDVDRVLRDNGFLFHKFSTFSSRMFKPLVNNNNLNAPGSQLLWADAVYMKDFMRLDELSAEKLLKLAIVLHEIYGSFDACGLVLQHYSRKANSNLSDSYLKRLVAGT
jgi:FkbM family methyltransferase